MTTHKLPISLAALAAAAATVLVLVVGARPGGSAGRTMKLTVSGTKISTVDVPPLITSKRSPETPGDEVIAVSKISGAASGHRYLDCAAARTAPSIPTALYACQVTYTLTNGTITAAGVVHLSGTATAAITGGTGAYSGARGVLFSNPASDTLDLQ